MDRRMSATEMYQKQRESLKVDDAMKKDAQQLVENESLRSGDVSPQKERDAKWQKELNEKLLREDHDDMTDKSFTIK